ncbi:hypothetical protein HDC92_001820 [Pedobacter sp. AK017]|uniref:hypothetical protein n=1 Tax=Pedobacter sp. AK017 TaxID=2723073 RepID=UPI00161A7BFF|nr:hypothetical protein [Pedobacter sp. AK017]MBB5438145.1 hypothetical protein [Pedobacter sp. AK017]
MRYLLKHINPIFFSFLLLIILLGFIWAIKTDQKPFPCGQQIPEEQMEALGRQGIKEVNIYLNHKGSCNECFELRELLLKKLKKKRIIIK